MTVMYGFIKENTGNLEWEPRILYNSITNTLSQLTLIIMLLWWHHGAG